MSIEAYFESAPDKPAPVREPLPGLTVGEMVMVNELMLDLARQRNKAPGDLAFTDVDILSIMRSLVGENGTLAEGQQKLREIFLASDAPVMPEDRVTGFAIALQAARSVRQAATESTKSPVIVFDALPNFDLIRAAAGLHERINMEPPELPKVDFHDFDNNERQRLKQFNKQQRKVSRPSWRR